MTILWNSSLLTRLVLFLPLSPCFCCFVWSVQVRLIANNSYASLIFELNYSWQYLNNTSITVFNETPQKFFMKQRNYGNVSQEAMQVVRLVRFHLEVCRMVAAWRYKRWHFHPQDTSTRHLTLAATLPCCLRLLWQLNMVIFYSNRIYIYNVLSSNVKLNKNYHINIWPLSSQRHSWQSDRTNHYHRQRSLPCSWKPSQSGFVIIHEYGWASR